MTVLSVVNGLAGMVANPAARGLVPMLLRGCRVQSHEANALVQSPERFRSFADLIDHYAGRDEEPAARAFLRYAGGERGSDIKWHLSPTPELATQVGLTIKPQTAKALLRLVSAVDEAQPKLLQFPAGRFVRHIASDGQITWAEIADPFSIADKPVSFNQFLRLANYIGLPPPPPKRGSMVADDPVLNVSSSHMHRWIQILSLLSETNFRLPKEEEWERVTCKNLPIVDLQKEARFQSIAVEEFVERTWHRRYANALITTAADRLAMGCGLINDSACVIEMLRSGLALSAWDFDSPNGGEVQNDGVYEVIFSGQDTPTVMRHIGRRYHRRPDELRNERPPYESSINTAFRLRVASNKTTAEF